MRLAFPGDLLNRPAVAELAVRAGSACCSAVDIVRPTAIIHAMKHVLPALALVLAAQSSAWATWSIVAVDKKTGQVIIASATCVAQAGFPRRQPLPSRDLMDVQAVIVPGRRRRRVPGGRRQHAQEPDDGFRGAEQRNRA